MKEEVQVLSGIAVKLLYSEPILKRIKELVGASQNPTKVLSQILAAVFQQAIAKAQKAGVKMTNQIATAGAMELVKEASEMIGEMGGIDEAQVQIMGKTLLATMLQSLKEITAIPKPSQPMQGQPEPQMQPPQGGLVQQAMGGM